MTKNTNLPCIYLTREKVTHTCLKSGPYMPKMMHTCLMHQIYCGGTGSALWEHKIWDQYCGNIGSVLWEHEIWELYSGNSRSAFWEHKIWDLHSATT